MGPTLGPQAPQQLLLTLLFRAGGRWTGSCDGGFLGRGAAVRGEAGGREGQKTAVLGGNAQKAVLQVDALQVWKTKRVWGG